MQLWKIQRLPLLQVSEIYFMERKVLIAVLLTTVKQVIKLRLKIGEFAVEIY